MTEILIEDILSGKENKYSLVVAVAKLARKLSQDAEEKEEELQEKPVLLAYNEIKNHKYKMFHPDEEI